MSADLIARMVAEGVSSSLIADVAMALARADADREAINTRREKDRTRQASRRHVMSRDVTLGDVTTCDIAETSPAPTPSPSSPPDPPNNPTPAPTPARDNTRARKGSRIAENFEPQITGKTAEMVKRWPPGRFDREVAQFRDFYAKTGGEKGLSLDWQASLRTWLRNADDRIPRNGQPSLSLPRPQGASTVRAADRIDWDALAASGRRC